MGRRTSGFIIKPQRWWHTSRASACRPRRVPTYVTVLLLALLLCALPAEPACGQSSSSQNSSYSSRKKKKKTNDDYPHYPLLNGLELAVDLWGPGAKLLGNDNLQIEFAADLNMKSRFFPIVELGYAKTDVWGDDGIHFRQGGAPYIRLGLDYNALYKKTHGHMLMVGLRYGFTSFKYDITQVTVTDEVYGGTLSNPNLEDDYWGSTSLPYSHQGMKGRLGWLEFVVGIRAHLSKRIYMGWAIRMKYKQSATCGTYGNPQNVPGYGKFGSSTMGVTYTITYKLPFLEKKR